MAADNDASDGGGVGETRHEKISRPETTNFDGGMHYSSPSPNFTRLRTNERTSERDDNGDDDDVL